MSGKAWVGVVIVAFWGGYLFGLWASQEIQKPLQAEMWKRGYAWGRVDEKTDGKTPKRDKPTKLPYPWPR